MRSLDWLEGAGIGLLVLLVLGFTLAIGAALYEAAKSPKFELVKKDWECAKWEPQTNFQPMPVGGGGMILMPVTIMECVEYRKR